jgi:hypothetical protein
MEEAPLVVIDCWQRAKKEIVAEETEQDYLKQLQQIIRNQTIRLPIGSDSEDKKEIIGIRLTPV